MIYKRQERRRIEKKNKEKLETKERKEKKEAEKKKEERKLETIAEEAQEYQELNIYKLDDTQEKLKISNRKGTLNLNLLTQLLIFNVCNHYYYVSQGQITTFLFSPPD